MPLEFALRPRIRLREDPPPRAPSRRSRLRVPRFALPAALYWAVVGGICYGIIRLHDAAPPEAALEARESASELPSAPGPVADVPGPPALATQAAAIPDAAPPAPSAEPSIAPSADDEPSAPVERPRALGEQVAAALLARHAPHLEERAPAAQHGLAPQTAHNAGDTLSALESRPTSEPEPRTALLPAPARGNGPSLPSCEAAAAAAVQNMDFASSDRSADLPSEAIAGVLENGAWIGSCALPSTTKLEVCVAIKGGRVMAATVTSSPVDPALNACIKQRAAALQFPYSTRVDVARTRF